MTTITIEETRGGVLIPLRDIVGRLPINQILRIRLRGFRMHFGQPLGMTLRDFESKTRSKEGIVLTPEDFRAFAISDMQIIDGLIELELQCGQKMEKLLVECVDATSWELSSESEIVMASVVKE